MVVEGVVGPLASGNLVAARYALMALWTAGFTAKPSLLTDLPWLLFVLLVAVAFVGAVVPGKNKPTEQAT
jgi:hypothetical protein